MATQPISESRLISVEEYLSTGYEPDCDYEDGLLVERSVGEFDHSLVQALLAGIFTNHMDAWGVYGLTEQRVQVAARHFLVPDVCVLRLGAPTDPIVAEPPLIAIEILSPQDRMARITKKAAEYRRFGIQNVWVIDPAGRVAYRGGAEGLVEISDGELAVAGTPIRLSMAELFERLDRIRASGRL